jgi:hypothetical protein
MKEERFYVVLLVVSRGVDSVSSGSSLITTRVPGTGYVQTGYGKSTVSYIIPFFLHFFLQ